MLFKLINMYLQFIINFVRLLYMCELFNFCYVNQLKCYSKQHYKTVLNYLNSQMLLNNNFLMQ